MDPGETTLLVVDDTAEYRDMLARRLTRKGFRVLVAETGPKALALVDSERVDLVLLDIVLPGMSGLEVLQRIRERWSPAELPVVMQTGKSSSEDVVEALELGANDYVTKPLDFPVVLARVHAQLRSLRPLPSTAPQLSGNPVGPGQLIAERYELGAAIGSGSFGTVFAGRHVELDRPVAVKVLQTGLASQPEALARMRREGMSACRVRHPNAVAVLDFGITPAGLAYLVMELLEGRSLHEELCERGRLAADRAIRILAPVCDVLATAHRSGVVHRDIKPSNIFLHLTQGIVLPKVLDFGIAKISGEAVGAHSTVAGAVFGTPAYMAPERFRPSPLDGKADVYSLGVTLYQMLTGRVPFEASEGDALALVMMHAYEVPRPPRELEPTIPSAVEAAILLALAKRAEARPSAAELGDLLRAGLAKAESGE